MFTIAISPGSFPTVTADPYASSRAELTLLCPRTSYLRAPLDTSGNEGNAWDIGRDAPGSHTRGYSYDGYVVTSGDP